MRYWSALKTSWGNALYIPSEKTLLALVREVVFARAGNRCEYPKCGSRIHLSSHHAVSRRNYAAKFDPDCCVCLCLEHHDLAEKNREKLVITLITHDLRDASWGVYLDWQERALITDKDAYRASMHSKCLFALREVERWK